MAPIGYITLLTLSCLSLVAQGSVKRLTKHLLMNYDAVGRHGSPYGNGTDKLHVEVNFGLIELREFDIEKQNLVMVGWTALEWQDPNLSWSAKDFEDIESLAIDPDSIWTPDVVSANSLSEPERIHETYAHVSSQGNVTWVSSYKYNLYCKIEREEMELDDFMCSINFGSWSMSSDELRLTPKRDRFDTEYYVPNREWEFFMNKARRTEVQLPWGNRKWSNIVLYEFTLKRRLILDEEDLESSAHRLLPAPLAMCLLSMLLLTGHALY